MGKRYESSITVILHRAYSLNMLTLVFFETERYEN